MTNNKAIQWHDMRELMEEKTVRYTPPGQKEHEAYIRGQGSAKWYIVGASVIGVLVGFFVGRSL